MKIIKSIILAGVGVLSLTSCNDWLDINSDPSSPNSESVSYETQLAHCQFYTNSAYQFASMRSCMAMGDFTHSSRTSTYGGMSQWLPSNSVCTTPYQWFFVGAGSNFAKMYEKATKDGAYHYAGAVKLLRAYGFMLMTDLYGEMPYTEALGENVTPKYDTGKTIFLGALGELDEAIELLSKTQDASLPSLAEGDSWNGGDVNKWLKMAYLLKARYINHLSKKQSGSYKDGKYDADEILACLEKAHKSNADNTIITHLDGNSTTHDVLGWDEPVDYSPLYSVIGMNSNYYVTKMLVDNFTNFAGNGIEDPRADHIIPWAVSVQSDQTPAEIKWNGKWRRSLGVDMNTLIRTEGAPYATSWDSKAGHWYCDSKTRAGDTIYVQQVSSSKGYAANKDLLYRKDKSNDNSAVSGTFMTRVSSPTYVAVYHEACFIKAEVLFNKGDKQGAFTAYKEGIKASIELMNSKLQDWVKDDPSLENCPSFAPMSQQDIDNYLNNGIGTAGDLSLAKIMTQKHMAMMFSVEQWNDMRRYDFSENVFLNWHIPAEYVANVSNQQRFIPDGSGFRRWRQCSHELKYNATNLQEIGSQVPGADVASGEWNSADAVWSIPVWWDSTQE